MIDAQTSLQLFQNPHPHHVYRLSGGSDQTTDSEPCTGDPECSGEDSDDPGEHDPRQDDHRTLRQR